MTREQEAHLNTCSRLSGAIMDDAGVNIEPEEIERIADLLAKNPAAMKDLTTLVSASQFAFVSRMRKIADVVGKLIGEDGEDILRCAQSLAENLDARTQFNHIVQEFNRRK